MNADYLMGVDIGTSSSKGAILDLKGDIIAKISYKHGISNPKIGQFEHDAEKIWWADFIKICKYFFQIKCIDPKRIVAVGCSALGANFVPIGEENEPLRPAILYGIDTRASSEIKEIKEIVGESKILEIAGNQLTSQSVGPKILWFKKNEPYLFKHTFKIIPAISYIVYKLTQKYAIDYYSASTYEPLFNLNDLTWDRDMCKVIGLSQNLFPEIHSPFDVIGYVNKSSSKETGLVQGTPVIVGSTDSLMEMISVGSIDVGEAVLVYGSTMIIMGIIKKQRIITPLILRPFIFSDMYILVGAMATSGILIKWFLDNLNKFSSKVRRNESDIYNYLNNQAGKITPGSEGLIVLPYFSGERTPIWDERARGMIIGLTISHTKFHIYRAILEGIAYALLQHMDEMRKVGFIVNEVKSIGGGIKNHLWVQIVSNVTGLRQFCISGIVDAYVGASYLAGYGIGIFNDFTILKESWIKTENAVLPDRKKWELYQKYYNIYETLYDATKKQMHDLSLI